MLQVLRRRYQTAERVRDARWRAVAQRGPGIMPIDTADTPSSAASEDERRRLELAVIEAAWRLLAYTGNAAFRLPLPAGRVVLGGTEEYVRRLL